MSKPRLIAIDTSALTEHDIRTFLVTFQDFIHSGNGKLPAASAELGLDPSTPLRTLVGLPEKGMRFELRRAIEAAFACALCRPIDAGIWTRKPNWAPANPTAATPLSTFDDVALDLEFIESFGLRRHVWEQYVFRLGDGVLSDMKLGRHTRTQMLRAYVHALAFGLPDPWQFFRPAQ